MRICFITPEYALHPPFGGIATYTRDAARWLRRHGNDVHVIQVSRNTLPCVENDCGVHVHTVRPIRIKPRRLINYAHRLSGIRFLEDAYEGWNLLEDSIGVWREIKFLAKRAEFDVIEVADYGGLGFWGMLQPYRRTPILVRSHGYANADLIGMSWPGIRFQHALESFTIRHADFILTASIERIMHYRSVFGVAPERIGALHLGVDVDAYQQGTTPHGGLDFNATVTVLYLGRVERRKGCNVLFSALSLVHDALPDVRVMFVGSVTDDMQTDFAAFLRSADGWALHLAAVPQEQVPSFLASSDMIVLPSRYETLPRVLVEALAAGLPQIATNVNGIPEIVEDGITGLLVDYGDPVGLASAIISVAQSPQRRLAMSQASRQRAQAQFELDTVMTRQIAVYQALSNGEIPFSSPISNPR